MTRKCFARVFASAAAALLLAGLASADPLLPAAPAHVAPTPTALAQISALLGEKSHRTATQRKIDSHLLMTTHMARGEEIAPGVPSLRTRVTLDAAGLTEVDIEGDVSNALLQAITARGGVVKSSFPVFHTVRARVPLQELETLAAISGVRFIKPAQQGHVISFRPALPSDAPLVPRAAPSLEIDRPPAMPFTRTTQPQREARVRTHLPTLLHQASEEILQGASSSTPPGDPADPEGDFAHRADLARKTFGATGKGIKVGVLSDSVDYLAHAQKVGALGPVTILPGQGNTGVGATGEGTAMLEIVHKLAPDANLYFATADGGEASFAQNIEDLQAAGCNIIVDDVQYFDESPFEDGIIAQAVDYVVARHAMYFSAAGNDFNLDAAYLGPGTSSTWEGDWKDSGHTFTYPGGSEPLLAFDAAGDYKDQIAAAPDFTEYANLFWANPLGGATDEYDLFILDANGNLVSASTNSSDGTNDPFQETTVQPGDYALVGLYSGNGVFLHLDVANDGASIFTTVGTDGATRGHDCADGAYDVAATDASISYARKTPFGPQDIVEYFSSDGPRRVFFHADGTPITPGNLSSTGGEVRAKPTITAADGVSIAAVPGFTPFYGTSAAGPHAAAIAALALSNNHGLKPGGIYEAISSPLLSPSAAIDIQAPGYDRDSGFGILDAYNLLLLTSPRPTITSYTPTSGPVGTTVTIHGTEFQTVFEVLFHGISAPFTVISPTEIKTKVPRGATTGPLELVIYQFGPDVIVTPHFLVTKK